MGLGKSCELLGRGKGHVQGLAQDMEGQKAVAKGPKCPQDHPVMLEVSTVGSGAEESPISAMIWVGGSSPMGAAQPPTSAPHQLPSASAQAPDGTGRISRVTRPGAQQERLRLLGRLGQELRHLQDISHPRRVIRQTCICSKGISKLKDSLK